MDDHNSAADDSAVDLNMVAEANPINETDTITHSPGIAPETQPCQFFLMGRCRFGERCRNAHTGLLQDSKSEKKHYPEQESSKPKGKKPPMKTASDVISRIQWDQNLPKDHFLIGYLDRFLGVIEKPFSAFCWEDLASVGHDVLAIPKHRIQYFKYKSLIVWDKSSRTDNVFGSTGSGMTILDIIDQYENLLPTEDEREDTASIENAENLENEYKGSSEDVDEGNAKAIRPTHFVAVRISNEEVRSVVKDVQNLLVEKNPDIAQFCVPIQTLHLTLCLLYLETSEEIQSAFSTLQELKCEIQRTLPPSLILCFEGPRDFNSRVLYLAPSAIPALEGFANTLANSFQSKGLNVIQPPHCNKFHVTIAKIPKNVLRKTPSLAMSSDIYKDTNITHFGAQQVDAFSFCRVGSSRGTDGFYTKLLELSLY